MQSGILSQEQIVGLLETQLEREKQLVTQGRESARDGKHHRAAIRFSEALQIRPQSMEALKNRGIAYGLIGQNELGFAAWIAP